jgi:hypothetical protein
MVKTAHTNCTPPGLTLLCLGVMPGLYRMKNVNVLATKMRKRILDWPCAILANQIVPAGDIFEFLLFRIPTASTEKL